MAQWIVLRNAPYGDVLERQRCLFGEMVERRRRGEDVAALESVMMVEHQPVYTMGRHGHRENLTDVGYLARRGAELVEIERGGDITFHGPDQLVVYPLIDLAARGMGVKAYVNALEESVIRTLAEYGIEGMRIEGATGVWLGVGTATERKICAIGVKCSRFVTMHGLALNVSTDLNWFGAINPCGFVDKGVTSIERETGDTVVWNDAARRLRRHLEALLFNEKMVSMR